MAQKCSTGHCRHNKGGNCVKSEIELKEITQSGASLGGKNCPGFKSKLP